MNKQVIIVLSGKKQAGKSSSCNYIAAKYLNKKGLEQQSNTSFHINSVGELCLSDSTITLGAQFPVKIYSFADPLKRFCIDVLGAPEESCYGDDAQKNAIIPHLMWDNLPSSLRLAMSSKHAEDFPIDFVEYRKGPMTGRELMQVIGTDFCRELYGDCWARGTYNLIKRENYPLALVNDGRFPNEITMGAQFNVKSIRLLRSPYKDNHASEKALDDFPQENYTKVIDNREMSLEQQCSSIDEFINDWI